MLDGRSSSSPCAWSTMRMLSGPQRSNPITVKPSKVRPSAPSYTVSCSLAWGSSVYPKPMSQLRDPSASTRKVAGIWVSAPEL